MMYFFFFKQKTAYEMRISDWSSDVCSSDLRVQAEEADMKLGTLTIAAGIAACALLSGCYHPEDGGNDDGDNGGTPPATQTTAGELAARQITTRTCDQGKPDAHNDPTITHSNARIDESTLTPGSTGGGPHDTRE